MVLDYYDEGRLEGDDAGGPSACRNWHIMHTRLLEVLHARLSTLLAASL